MEKDAYNDNEMKNGNDGDVNDSGADIDIEDFLKQGGIDLEEVDESELTKEKQFPTFEEKKEEVYNTDPDEKMHGWLTKSSLKMGKDGNSDILDSLVNGIGSGLKMGLKILTETV